MTKLLIVDDNKQNLYMLRVLLEGNGYEVGTAGDGAEALEKARRDPPDMIISDILMPVMDGFTLCREWKRDDRLKGLPFVFYTATYTDPKDEEFALSLGAERFIVKPVEPGVFVEMLREVIEEAEEGRLVAPREPIEEEPVYLKQYSERLVKKLEDKMLQLERANRRLTTLYQASTSLASIKPLGELVPYALRTVVEAMGYACANYFAFDEEKQEFRLLEAVGFSEGMQATFRRELVFSLGEERGLVGLVGRAREPLIVADTRSDPRWITLDETIRSALFVPVVHDSRLLGVANLLSTEVGAFSDEDTRNVMTLVNNVAIAIENARLFEEVERSELRYRTILESSADAIVSVDPEGKTAAWSAGAERIFGHTREEIVGQPLDILVPEHDRQPTAERLKEAGQRGFVRGWETQRRAKDGRLVDVEITVSDLGPELGFTAILRDITERKRAEEALREAERRFRTLLDNVRLIAVGLDEEGNVTYANPYLLALTGHTLDETLGKNWFQTFIPARYRPAVDTVFSEIMEAGIHPHYENPILTKAGEERLIAWNNTLLLDPNGKPVGTMSIGEDITERKRAEEELRQSYAKLQRALEGTVTTLVSVIEIRDPYTAGHQWRTTQLACAIARDMGLPDEQSEGLRMAGLIHDLGKINVPAEILSNPGPLSDFQWGLIKAHPQIGYDILKAVEFPWPVAETVLQHHERLDGSGYPQGLSSRDILMKAKILAAADVVEAMASFRPYRPARGIDKALEEISQNRGILYDPEVVDACLKLFTEKEFTFE